MLRIKPTRVVPLVFSALLACAGRTDKDRAEKLNEEKFGVRAEKREAQFLVDAIDASYAILEVAQLGEERLPGDDARGMAKQLVEGHTSVAVKLKTFAEAADVSIPFSGPERTRNRVHRLRTMEGEEFADAWNAEMMRLQRSLLRDVEEFRTKSDSASIPALDSTVRMIRKNQLILSKVSATPDQTEM